MSITRTVTFAAAAALIAGSALAQAPVTPPTDAPAQAPAADPAAPAAPGAPAAEGVPAAEGAAPAEAAPPAPPSPAALAFRPLPATNTGNLQATLQAAGQFSKFLTAAEKTGLMPFLTGTRQLTILAPTDTAFDTLGPGKFEELAAVQPATELQGILVRHIIATRIAPDQIAGKKGPVPTAAQTTVEIDGSVTPMKVNEAVVLQNDVQTSNGVIYVIDRVL